MSRNHAGGQRPPGRRGRAGRVVCWGMSRRAYCSVPLLLRRPTTTTCLFFPCGLTLSSASSGHVVILILPPEPMTAKNWRPMFPTWSLSWPHHAAKYCHLCHCGPGWCWGGWLSWSCPWLLICPRLTTTVTVAPQLCRSRTAASARAAGQDLSGSGTAASSQCSRRTRRCPWWCSGCWFLQKARWHFSLTRS